MQEQIYSNVLSEQQRACLPRLFCSVPLAEQLGERSNGATMENSVLHTLSTLNTTATASLPLAKAVSARLRSSMRAARCLLGLID